MSDAVGARLTVRRDSWPLAKPFTISRGSKTVAEVVVAEISVGAVRGRGEGVPYARYGEPIDGVADALAAMSEAIAGGLDRDAMQDAMKPGGARNALDVALWDLAAKQSGGSVWALADIVEPQPVVTAYTLSLDTPQRMGAAAREEAHRPLLNPKLARAAHLQPLPPVPPRPPHPP